MSEPERAEAAFSRKCNWPESVLLREGVYEEVEVDNRVQQSTVQVQSTLYRFGERGIPQSTPRYFMRGRSGK